MAKARFVNNWADACEEGRALYYSPWGTMFRKIEACYRLLDGEMLAVLTFAIYQLRGRFPHSRLEFKARWLEIWAAYRDDQRKQLGVLDMPGKKLAPQRGGLSP